MKRFTETTKWGDPWFRRLAPEFKALWLYLQDSCDNAGVWVVDLELAGFQVGANLELKAVLGVMGDRIEVIEDGRSWWIPEFIREQYGKLSGESKPHMQVLGLLEKRGLGERVCKGYVDPLGRVKDKDKDKDKDKGESEGTTGVSANAPAGAKSTAPATPGMVRMPTRPPPRSEQEVIEAGKTLPRPVGEQACRDFFDHYQAQGWLTASHMPVTDWVAKLRGWGSENRNGENGKFRQPETGPGESTEQPFKGYEKANPEDLARSADALRAALKKPKPKIKDEN